MSESSPLPPPLPPPRWIDRVDAVAAALGVDRRRVLAVVAVASIAAVVLAGFVVTRSVAAGNRQPPELSLPRATARDRVRTPTSAGGLVVAAAGAVAKPGVYRLAGGARVVDVIQAAGGTTAEADLDQVNLAAKVNDGERVYVARKGETPPPVVSGGGGSGGGDSTGGGSTGVVIDLNTATADQLEALPGVGPSTAQAILDYRKEHGRFRSVDELLEVRGIGEAKLAQIRPHVRV